MTFPLIATVTDLGVRLEQTLTGSAGARAQAVLEDVSALARKLSGDSGRWVSADGLTATAPQDVVAVVLAASRRLFRNPEGFASEQDGDYSYRIGADSLATGGGVFTESEVDLLHSYRDTSELWSQRLTGSDDLTRLDDGLLTRIWDETFQ